MLQRFDDLTFEVEHIIALKHGGRTRADNLALACYPCNAYKGPNIAGIDPHTESLVRLFHPRLDDWHNHFVYNGPQLVGKTDVGRATIVVLRINLRIRVQFRRLLIAEGVFPPSS